MARANADKERRIQKALAQARILMLEKYNLWEYLFVMLNDFEEFLEICSDFRFSQIL